MAENPIIEDIKLSPYEYSKLAKLLEVTLDKQYKNTITHLKSTQESLYNRLDYYEETLKNINKDYNELWNNYINQTEIEELKRNNSLLQLKIKELEDMPVIKYNWLTRLFIKYED